MSAKKRVLVQAGHIAPREPGFESGTGTEGEQQYVRLVRAHLLHYLGADGRFEAIGVPGDIPDGIKVDAALFLHCDGSGDARSSGFSFGYPGFAINKRLADFVAAEFFRLKGHPPHHSDNYTGGLAGYYGYSRVDTPGPEVLIEHGFLTNPDERRWMNGNVAQYAKAEYRALVRYFFGTAPAPTPGLMGRWAVSVVAEDGEVIRGKTRSPALRMRHWNRVRPRVRSVDFDRIGG